jgi:hypothetical protein
MAAIIHQGWHSRAIQRLEAPERCGRLLHHGMLVPDPGAGPAGY